MRLIAKVCSLILTAVSLPSLPLFVQANDKEALSALNNMSSAMQSLSYEGTFVQMRNGHTNLIHVLHANDEHGTSERMRSLNGEAREVIRSNSLVICIWPDTDDLIVNRSKPSTIRSPIKNYTVMRGGEARVAGIKTDVIDLRPNDDFRYGYRFWADKETGMMLRSMVIGTDNQPVEELMFTAIEYLDQVDPARFSVDANQNSTQWVDVEPDTGDSSEPAVDKVSFEGLPSGFEERAETLRMIPVSADEPVSHVVVSDGFSTVSVYVEYTTRENQEATSLGLTHMGAINAFGLSLPNALVTAVGEAPGKTVENIARAARLVD